jgi:hypothetical protein
MLSQQNNERGTEKELRQACAELERRLRAGEDCHAENLLAACPILAADAESAVELLYAEFVLWRELGRRPDPEDWQRRFPQWHDRLARLFQVDQALQRELPSTSALSQVQPTASFQPGMDADRCPVAPGRHVGGYEVLAEVGRGGMGVVYEARQQGTNRVVALKMILAGEYAGPAEVARFRVEGEAAAALQHPNIVQIFEVGDQDGHPFFSLEFVEGSTLEKRLHQAPLNARQAAQLLETLA